MLGKKNLVKSNLWSALKESMVLARHPCLLLVFQENPSALLIYGRTCWEDELYAKILESPLCIYP